MKEGRSLNMNDKISVIIPVYNGEKYIKKCLSSLIDQEYKNLEIIVVNNASTDRTVEKIKEINDNRIKLFTISEKGVSNARNYGIEKSTGDYIIFIDADDWLDNEMLSIMMNKIKEIDGDIVRVNYVVNKYDDKVYSIGKVPKEYQNKFIKDKKKLIKDIIMGKVTSYVWLNLIKKQLIIKNNITFDKNIYLLEDKVFYIQLVLVSNKIYFMNSQYYHYCYNEDSAMHSIELEKALYNSIKVHEKIDDTLKDNYKELINYSNILSICSIEGFIFDTYVQKGKKEAIALCEKIRKNERVNWLLQNYKKPEISEFKKYNFTKIKCLEEKNYKKLMNIYFYEKINYKTRQNLAKIKSLIKKYI